MRTSLKQRAAQASLNSRMCRDCKIGSKACTKEILDICHKAFVAGYIKGSKGG